MPYPQTVPAAPPEAPRAPFRRIQFSQRYEGLGPQMESFQTPAGEGVLVVSGGLNVVIQGLTVEGIPEIFGPLGDVDIETDRAVIWGIDSRGMVDTTDSGDRPLEIYMEGNIVFRQGERIVYADRMFYDVRSQTGVILDAELLTPPPPIGDYEYQGLVRLKAAALRQLDAARFIAYDGFITTSRLEEPSYHFGSQTITFQDIQQPQIDPHTGAPAVDYFTGEPLVTHQQLVTSQSNFVYVAGVPVFYWPTIVTDLRRPSYYVDDLRIRNDRVFGFQTLVSLDAFQLLGMERPAGVEWALDVDYLSRRGLGAGTHFSYDRDSFLGIAGPTFGQGDFWVINDTGRDNLGQRRRAIDPEEEFRGRAFWNHRQRLIGGPLDAWTVQAEIGWISDRTFLEQYYEREWDENKDQTTGVRLKRTFDNQSLSVEANARLNDFFTQTQWLPRLDHYWLGQPLIYDRLTWFAHSQAAYANIGVATEPTNATLAGQWTLLPWEFDSAGARIGGRGERLVTRQEIDFPFDFEPFKVVPYALGELGHWGADVDGDDIQRAYYQVGLRASIPFWAVDPTVRDAIFNLNGLAHKVVFDAEVSIAEANRDLDQFPLYDELDDDVFEEIRRRLFYSPFGGGLVPTYYMLGPPSTIDPKFDPRYYALRSGLGGWVTSPSTEIADDMTLVRLGMRHRLQTKRGPLGEERIVDWFTFDTNATWFPRASRDNFDQDIGLVDYDLAWHLGDRVSILSDGAADFFGDGLRTVSLGGRLARPQRGSIYVGLRAIDGPFTTNVLNISTSYRMSPKWIGATGSTITLSGTGNTHQNIALSRIGESLVATIGAHYNQSKDNFGVSFLLEPRFLPTLSVTRRTGIEIPPVGAYGLE